MSNNNPVYIPTVEAKDLYNSNNLARPNAGGYSVRLKDGRINLRKFINTLDYSLDLIKLREIYEKIYRRHDFSFRLNRKEYTQQVINVNFNYSQKLFNKASPHVYVRNGWQLRDIMLQDHICVSDGELIAIEVNAETDTPYKDLSVLGKYFIYEDKQYKFTGRNETIMTKADLRKYLYTGGFMCDGTHYVRWKRSSGSSRVGKCLFINEALYSRMHKWETCGIKIKDGDEVDLAAFEAYISLTLSSIIDTIEIKPENFLIIDDFKSEFEDNAVAVTFENGCLKALEQKIKVVNSIFDGESLMDTSLFPDKYKKYGMLLLRNRMFKSASFHTNLQQWFADNNITDIKQLNGFTLAEHIEDIKIVTTPSSIKYCKFGSVKDWLHKIEPTFGIVKHEKPTHYFDGRKVRCHYQLINTLQLSEKKVNALVKPSLDYIARVRDDPDVLRYHIHYPQPDTRAAPLNSKNEIVFKLLGINQAFSRTKLYKNFRDDLVRSMIHDLKQGHILINGNYSTLLGNGMEMLMTSIGKFDGSSFLGKGNIYTKRFRKETTLLCSRSPHICAGNVLLVTNKASPLIDKYFNLSNEIVYINSIGENTLQQLNGADFDSDTVLLTDNKILIEAAERNRQMFKIPTCCVDARKTKRFYTSSQKADLDIKTSVNKIGEIVNLSQLLNSIFWQNVFNGQSIESNNELYMDICKLAVLSNLEIDRAKKEYAVNSASELRRIKEKYKITEKSKIVRPMFFKNIVLDNGYKLSGNIRYKYFRTPMDYLQKQISAFNFHSRRQDKDEMLPFSAIVKPPDSKNIGSGYYKQRNRIINIIENTDKEIKALYCGYSGKNKEERDAIHLQALNLRQDCVEYINDLTISENTVYLLLKTLSDKNYRYIHRRIFEILFGAPNKTFFRMIIDNHGEINKLIEDNNGDIELYDLKFLKEAVNF